MSQENSAGEQEKLVNDENKTSEASNNNYKNLFVNYFLHAFALQPKPFA